MAAQAAADGNQTPTFGADQNQKKAVEVAPDKPITPVPTTETAPADKPKRKRSRSRRKKTTTVENSNSGEGLPPPPTFTSGSDNTLNLR
jgi:hypothetical protein